MGSTQFGKFHDFCRDSTLPVCNLFIRDNQPPNEKYGGCALTGINLSSGRHIGNLGSILLCFIAIFSTLFLIWRSERKRAAVGRREIQLFLIGFIIISICEIFSVGAFPLSDSIRKGFSAAHVAAICATAWLLLLNAIVGYQLIDDGTAVSLGLLVTSALILFVGTGYIALDTAFAWTDRFQSSHRTPNQNIGLYILYLLFPLICIVGFFLLETFLVVKVLKEKRPMLYLSIAGLLFALSQIFQFVISTHLCNATDGKINGAFFETLFNLGAVNMVWVFWSSITEDDWPMNVGGAYS
ncbi:hypothetical protein H112_01760 [Trichophyton rubrum D6]|uniref:Uncharacterized protein n=4 Tax=Trichophyton TaxID=5550 RepID=F2SVG1_TRIRC|nr:uncharacterized protein TERG_06532 [Trichophyton rubrum CBS 118892]EZF26061.1 hypothetical protein H100_01756 [Trichophyton rubrum MR850]EZF45013.1 hypothetical protein H102_01749 [Trichophyton rubrum CBS 100081]EZF55705.1 hypothetical protein H103_01760 [Trichophyton rubrum CBS 288.86]EZF66343.1 hypothetical protein H104_01738 [Trichophyton rubrum CBS 289.86]EZF76931.1 hypothetical protein H105_01765 [Trichophyton soudanense CBS 452.61]EZF87567.1 hypothetical protein H110_01761 [Trichophy